MKYVNEAGWDRIARVVLGIVLLALGWSGVTQIPHQQSIIAFISR
jgi:hypothetical protein